MPKISFENFQLEIIKDKHAKRNILRFSIKSSVTKQMKIDQKTWNILHCGNRFEWNFFVYLDYFFSYQSGMKMGRFKFL